MPAAEELEPAIGAKAASRGQTRQERQGNHPPESRAAERTTGVSHGVKTCAMTCEQETGATLFTVGGKPTGDQPDFWTRLCADRPGYPPVRTPCPIWLPKNRRRLRHSPAATRFRPQLPLSAPGSFASYRLLMSSLGRSDVADSSIRPPVRPLPAHQIFTTPFLD